MGYKSRGNWQVGFCIKHCSNKGILCDECVRFSHFIEGNPPAVDFCPINFPVEESKNTAYNKVYRQARNLKEQFRHGLCTVRETKEPTDKNVHKMIHSEFALKKKIDVFKQSMKAIHADPGDYNVEKLRRR